MRHAALRAVLGWELRRLGAIALVFAVPDLLFALAVWHSGRTDLLDPQVLRAVRAEVAGAAGRNHLGFAALLALFLGSLSAGSGAEEGNLEFLLVRNLGRTAIWLLTTAAGLLVLVAFSGALPLLGWLAGWPVQPIFEHPWLAAALCGLFALYWTAAAVGGLSHRPALSIPIAAVLFALVGGTALYATQSLLLRVPPGSFSLPRTVQLERVLVTCFLAMGLLGGAVSWATVWCHRDPIQRRRLLAGLVAGLALLAGTGLTIVVDRATLSPGEAVEQFLQEGERRYAPARIYWFSRPVAVPRLRDRLQRARPDSVAERLLQSALHRYGEPDGAAYFSKRWQQLARDGGPLSGVDGAMLLQLDPMRLDRATRDAIFRLAAQQAQRSPAAERALIHATSLLDRPRATRIWIPRFRELARAGRWSRLLRSIKPSPRDAWGVSWSRSLVKRTLFQVAQVDHGADLPDDVVELLLAAYPRAKHPPERKEIAELLAATRRPAALPILFDNWTVQFDGRWRWLRNNDILRGIDTPAVRRFALERIERPRAGRDERWHAALLLAERQDPRVLPHLRKRLRESRYYDDARKLLDLDWPVVWRLIALNTPAGWRSNLIARARLQDARAVEQLLEGYRRSQPSPYWVGARAGRGRWQFRESVERLFDAAVGSRDPRLLAALTELCHDPQADTALTAAVLLADAGRPAGIAALIDLLDRPPALPWQTAVSSIHLAANHLQRVTGQRLGADTRAWRAWFQSRKQP